MFFLCHRLGGVSPSPHAAPSRTAAKAQRMSRAEFIARWVITAHNEGMIWRISAVYFTLQMSVPGLCAGLPAS